MGFFAWLRRFFLGPGPVSIGDADSATEHASAMAPPVIEPPVLVPLRHHVRRYRKFQPIAREADTLPYRFARFSHDFDGFLDLTGDVDRQRLERWGLPLLQTPDELADWLGIKIGELAWLTHRTLPGHRPANEQGAHYHFRWMEKRSGGHRLIQSPKPLLKRVQHRILDELLSRVPAHEAAHGFVAGRSILTNAAPHVGKRVLLKLDLENFYATVAFNRVCAIFRGMGFCREAAIWLARLTTSPLPPSLHLPRANAGAIYAYFGRTLPQGAPTSPALANLSAFSLDVRLAGLAKSFGATYTRYADDLTFSGSQWLLDRLAVFYPLVTQVIRSERFRINGYKRRVVRDNQRQSVTGVVVNERTNISRKEYDLLKAILTNCVRTGPGEQNRDGHDDFQAHLRGRIAHVTYLNPERGRRLLEIYGRIAW